MNLKSVLTACAALAVAACTNETKLTQYVDPKIGTSDHGHVFVGANVPFGMVQLGPTSIPQEWDWCSGYHESDETVIGFSHTHLSGTGIGDLFDITVMPVVGDVTYARGTEEEPESGLWSYADRTREVARAGYYSVPLKRYGITAELTATERVGFHRYTFPASDNAAIVFDLENGGCWDKVTDAGFVLSDDNTRISGWRRSEGWAKDQFVFFAAEFSKPAKSIECLPAADMNGKNPEIDALYARIDFDTEENEQILVKVAISPVSISGAEANLAVELPHWDFDGVVAAAEDKWENELGKVRIETKDERARRIFYTALYHTMVAPSIFCDVDGSYRGADGKVYAAPAHKTYTTFSLWDTYRAAMPLMTIIHREKMADIINTMLAICDEQGRLPVWHLWGNETDCMIGNPAITCVADAIVKGFDGFDYERAFAALKTTALYGDRGGAFRDTYGYIPCDLYNEAVANDMEYAIADAAVAQAALALGKSDEAEFFTNRSHSYRWYFDPETNFMRGRDSKGGWRTSFSPYASRHRIDDYCEGNAWQYTWLVPHDVKGLQECFGSRERMLEKLDSLFVVSSVIEGDASPDISGLIGQYAHGNEPSHHILYLYAMLGEPHKTADKVREVLANLYHDTPAGLSGNEDVGQMSAWYILSSMGLYEVEPAGGRYWFGSPIFDKVTISLPDGEFVIEARNNSDANRYIQSVTLNGAEYTKPYISYADIAAGGELVFEMGSEPAVWYPAEEL